MPALSKLSRPRLVFLLEGLRNGLTRVEAADLAEVHRTTVWRWAQKYEDLRDAMLEAEKQGAERRKYRLWVRHPFRGQRPPGSKYDPSKRPAFRAPNRAAQFRARVGL